MSSDFGPTAPWPVRWVCDISTESPTITGAAVAFASDVLWALSGRQFGLTTVKLRPMCDWGNDTPWPDGWLSWPGTQPPPLSALGTGGYFGLWFGYQCSGCVTIMLPAPIDSISEVKINGTVLSTNAYRLDEGRYLVRTGGLTWPLSNDLTRDDTQLGTWSVTANFGQSVPSSADIAVGELACEYIKGLRGEDCRLPRAVTQLVRQGVTISLPDISTQFKSRLTGLYFVDMFISTWNPNHLTSRARTYSVDSGTMRR